MFPNFPSTGSENFKSRQAIDKNEGNIDLLKKKLYHYVIMMIWIKQIYSEFRGDQDHIYPISGSFMQKKVVEFDGLHVYSDF